jgi:hypothetical protein
MNPGTAGDIRGGLSDGAAILDHLFAGGDIAQGHLVAQGHIFGDSYGAKVFTFDGDRANVGSGGQVDDGYTDVICGLVQQDTMLNVCVLSWQSRR